MNPHAGRRRPALSERPRVEGPALSERPRVEGPALSERPRVEGLEAD
jgi:hypothetical protein